MRVRTQSVICLLACLLAAVPMLAQRDNSVQNDPLSGVWTGDWGPNARDRNQVNVELKWDGRNLTGVVRSVRPARPDVTLGKSSFDAATGTVKMEAEAQDPRTGASVKYMIEGKLDGDTMTGSWNHDSRRGDFTLTKSGN